MILGDNAYGSVTYGGIIALPKEAARSYYGRGRARREYDDALLRQRILGEDEEIIELIAAVTSYL
ncbi:MAG: hypothetical protein BA863_04040 [Desulfovibrio sp. S3730MH75]|nr:MAG: hypothetical protein BA863_04040 [Desulfovibrio sp. S3730MH75]